VPAPPRERVEYFPALDGLRAVAIAGVLFAHLLTAAGFMLDPSRGSDRAIVAAGLRGWMGVDLFFVLSGFLITRILLRSRDAPGYYQRFYARRVLRIFPLYYTVLALALTVLPRLSATFQAQHSASWVYWFYVSNIPAAAAVAWTEPPQLAHFWSLAVEEQFYIVWPAVLKRGSLRVLLLLCAAVIAAAIAARIVSQLAGAPTYFNCKMLFTRMDALAMGGLLACLESVPAIWGRVRRFAPGVVIAGGVLVLAFGRGLLAHPLTTTVGFSAIALTSGGLILAALDPSPRSRLRRVLECRPLQYVGQRSYAIYVLHPLVIAALAAAPIGRMAGQLSGVRGFVTFGIVAAAATLVAAEISWRVVERPMLTLKRFVPRPAVPPVVTVTV
jgi:peptidoglycan/LPS O-acetylase OafA/YrhL